MPFSYISSIEFIFPLATSEPRLVRGFHSALCSCCCLGDDLTILDTLLSYCRHCRANSYCCCCSWCNNYNHRRQHHYHRYHRLLQHTSVKFGCIIIIYHWVVYYRLIIMFCLSSFRYHCYYYCCVFAVASKFSEIFCLITSKCEGYSSGSNPSFIRAENIELYFASSAPFMILAYSAICFPFVRSSEGRVSSETGTFTPAATIPFKHAAMRDVNEFLPV